MHPIQSSASPEYEVQKPEWGSMGEAIEWFSTLRKAVRDVVHRAGRNIREAKDIFEELNSAHYRDYIYLDSQQQNMRNWWMAFKGQREITIEFLGQQEFLCNGFPSAEPLLQAKGKGFEQFQSNMLLIQKDPMAHIGHRLEVESKLGGASGNAH